MVKFMQKIGIMGGTFNPIHNAHLMLAQAAYEQYQLDGVMFLPSKHPAYKNEREIVSPQLRSEMIHLCIDKIPYFSLNTMEYDREGNTYTADTLRILHEQNPEISYFFIMGADSLYQLEKWHEFETVLQLSTIIAAPRNEVTSETIHKKIHELTSKYQAKIYLLSTPVSDISSHEIREMIQKKQSIDDLVPAMVSDYIKTHQLYMQK